MLHDPWFYAAAIPAMIILGLAKGGFTSAGLVSVPLMALVISPVQAAGIQLPILVLTDLVAVVAYWGTFDRRLIAIMLPGSILGVLLGWLTAAWVTEHEVRLIVGIIAVLFAVNWWFRHRKRVEPRGHDPIRGTFWGAVSGFTSFVSHAGGPPFQIYALPLRLEPRVFAGSSVLLFAVVNAIKTVPYFFLGQFNPENLKTAAVLLPVSIAATLVGVRLVKKVERESFYKIIYTMFFLVGLYLVWQGLAGIL